MKILFVCTGNTCRSPKAMCLANGLGHDARSAGLQVQWEGVPASDGAEWAMARRGLTLHAHRAHLLTAQDVVWADRILCMTPAHAQTLTSRHPLHAHKIAPFPDPIPDPYGASDEVYEQVATLIEVQLDGLL